MCRLDLGLMRRLGLVSIVVSPAPALGLNRWRSRVGAGARPP
ncbi:MAG: hypothetical protein RLZZ611_1397 [Cyanobacteriota bacterium]